jgi:hypothetical protein
MFFLNGELFVGSFELPSLLGFSSTNYYFQEQQITATTMLNGITDNVINQVM